MDAVTVHASYTSPSPSFSTRKRFDPRYPIRKAVEDVTSSLADDISEAGGFTIVPEELVPDFVMPSSISEPLFTLQKRHIHIGYQFSHGETIMNKARNETTDLRLAIRALNERVDHQGQELDRQGRQLVQVTNSVAKIHLRHLCLEVRKKAATAFGNTTWGVLNEKYGTGLPKALNKRFPKVPAGAFRELIDDKYRVEGNMGAHEPTAEELRWAIASQPPSQQAKLHILYETFLSCDM